jgi:hypothetical protein
VQYISWLLVQKCGAQRQWSMTKVKVMCVHIDRLRVVKGEL